MWGLKWLDLFPFSLWNLPCRQLTVGRQLQASGCTWTAGETIGQAYPTVQLLCVELYIADCWEERESKICFLEAQMIQAT